MKHHVIAACLLIGAAVYAANELSTVATVNYNKSGAQIQATKQTSITISGNTYCDQVWDAPTNETQVTLCSGLTTPGVVFLQNLDASNTVLHGTTSGSLGGKLKAGEWALFRMASTNLYLRADTTNVLVRSLIFPD
jgi:hypothetical protein